MKKRNVLIFPAGTEIGLEIYGALRHCKEVRVFGAGQAVSNHAEFLLPEYHVLPSIHEEGWLEGLVSLVRRLEIDYIFPAYDDVIVALSELSDRIPAKIVTSPAETCAVARSKSRTYRALAGKVRVPVLYDAAADSLPFPLLVKPDRGQGAQGVTRVEDRDELRHALRQVNEPILCEYLPGEEYTVDCFSDREKGLLFAGARVRRRIRNGISVNTTLVDLPEAWGIAQGIGAALPFHGAWFFQLKRAADGELTLLEVAPRIAGSMAAHRVLGVNFPLLGIFESERVPYTIAPIKARVELDRALVNRYRHDVSFDTVYVDLDDTLLIENKVNTQLVGLLFQCVNEGKKVVLLTRHRGDVAQTLATHRLTSLFDDIIHVPPDRMKSAFVTERNSIFIDDSFAERTDVGSNCGILTFDCSMIELLLR